MKIGDKITIKEDVERTVEDIVTGVSENRGVLFTLVMVCRNGVEKWIKLDNANG